MIYNPLLCYTLFASANNGLAPYARCGYADGATFASVYNPGLIGPTSGLVWANATSGILPSGSFCECASGYGDPLGMGSCVPLYGSNAIATVDPLAASPAAVLQLSSVVLKNNILSFAINSPLTVGRNTTWFLSASSPSYNAGSMTLGGAWQLSGSNNVACRRPGIYDVSLRNLATPITSDSILAGLDWTVVNGNKVGNVSQCGFTSSILGNQYINTAILTVVTSDLIPNTTLTRQSAATYPIRVSAPRTVTVSAPSISVNSTIALTAAAVTLVYNPSTSRLSLILQTSVASPYVLSNVSATPPSGLFTDSSFTMNEINQCSDVSKPCVQQFVFNGTASVSTLCPASAPQQGTLNGAYTFVWTTGTRSGNASIPNSSATVNLQSGNICQAVTVGVVTQASLMPYSDAAFTTSVPSRGFVPGQRTYWQIQASSTQVSVQTVQINRIWYGPSALITTAVPTANITYATGSSNIAYPSPTTSYPQVRTLWSYQDALQCSAGATGYPTTPNAPATPGIGLATCPAFSSAGVGLVQSPWLTAPSSSPELLYPNGTTQLGLANNLAVTHRVASGGMFTSGVSTASASFAHDTSILVTGSQPINSPNATNATLNYDYSSCNATLGMSDPCQKYLYPLNANTFAQFAYAVSLTITYAGTSSVSSAKPLLRKRNIVLTSNGQNKGDDLFQVQFAKRMQKRDYYSSQQDTAALMSSEIQINASRGNGGSSASTQGNSAAQNIWIFFNTSMFWIFILIPTLCAIAVVIICCQVCFKRWRGDKRNDFPI